jgi:glycosyltransferase involved in cell wall biosynthesis
MMLTLMLVIPHLDAGGAEKLMLTLCDHLDKNIFRLTLVVLNRTGVFSRYQNPAVEIIDLGCPRVLASFSKLVRLVREKKPDLVFSALSHLNIVMALVRLFSGSQAKFVAREASLPSLQNRNEKRGVLLDLGIRLLYNRFDAIVCQSKQMGDDLTVHYGVRPGKIVIIHNPADRERIERLAHEPAPKAYRTPGKRLIAVGRLSREKGYDRLLRILHRLPAGEWECLIAGDGPERKNLEALKDELGLADRVQFLGTLENPFPRIAAADIFLLTSFYEGFPNAVLEALACGVPVVALRCPGGIAEIIQDGKNGFLLEDEQALIGFLARPRAPEWTKKQIVADISRRFEAEKIVGHYARLFSEVQAAG